MLSVLLGFHAWSPLFICSQSLTRRIGSIRSKGLMAPMGLMKITKCLATGPVNHVEYSLVTFDPKHNHIIPEFNRVPETPRREENRILKMKPLTWGSQLQTGSTCVLLSCSNVIHIKLSWCQHFDALSLVQTLLKNKIIIASHLREVNRIALFKVGIRKVNAQSNMVNEN